MTNPQPALQQPAQPAPPVRRHWDGNGWTSTAVPDAATQPDQAPAAGLGGTGR